MKKSKLIAQIQKYLSSPASERDIPAGALLLIQMNRNQILYRNILLKPEKFAPKLFYELGKFVNLEVTEERTSPKTPDNPVRKVGKREDHDRLPEVIQSLYLENGSIAVEKRSLHEKIKLSEGAPAEEIAPRVAELKELDKVYRSNWTLYDHYEIGTPIPEALLPKSKELSKKDLQRKVSDLKKNLKALAEGPERIRTLFLLSDSCYQLIALGHTFSDKNLAELKHLGVIFG